MQDLVGEARPHVGAEQHAVVAPGAKEHLPRVGEAAGHIDADALVVELLQQSLHGRRVAEQGQHVDRTRGRLLQGSPFSAA